MFYSFLIKLFVTFCKHLTASTIAITCTIQVCLHKKGYNSLSLVLDYLVGNERLKLPLSVRLSDGQ